MIGTMVETMPPTSAPREPDRKTLLGEFVRAHRESLAPEPSLGRRRTPGLRREELAARAGISATWCTWIEQGRDVQVSPQALARLALALALNRAERAYLFELAGRRDPLAPSPDDATEAPASLQAAVAALAHPAYGLDRLWNACCWNEAAERLFTGWLSEGCQRNLLRFVFVEPAARTLIPTGRTAPAACWRNSAPTSAAGSTIRACAKRSTACAATARCSKRNGTRRACSGARAACAYSRIPPMGSSQYTQFSFSPAERPDYKLVMLVPRP